MIGHGRVATFTRRTLRDPKSTSPTPESGRSLARPRPQLGLSLFDRASFRSTKAAVELHTLLDLRGSSNMNASEVIANRALEVLRHAKGAYGQLRRWSLSCNQRSRRSPWN
jgi:hypothetical protein